jgi:predicted CxxxxCH...CXXCH cytochrome family protein
LVVAPETCSNVTCHLCNIPVVQSWLDPIVAMGWDQLFSILQ